MQKVHFINNDRAPALKDRKLLKAFLEQLFISEGKTLASLNYIFCSDKYLLEVNRQFLDHDYFTDVITFDLSEKRQPVAGEVYISVDRVKDNATGLGVSFKNELHRVLFHAALHLCGYDDKTKKGTLEMRSKEDYYLNIYKTGK